MVLTPDSRSRRAGLQRSRRQSFTQLSADTVGVSGGDLSRIWQTLTVDCECLERIANQCTDVCSPAFRRKVSRAGRFRLKPNEVKLGADALPVPMEAQSRRMVKLFAFKLAIFQIASRVFLK